MILKILISYRRQIILGLLPFLTLSLINITGLSYANAGNEPRATNIKWSAKVDVITITYDLIGSLQVKYKVNVVLKKDNDSTFNFSPISIEGDVGEGYYAGTSKQIIWYYQRDYPQGVQGKGYYFEIDVKQLEIDRTWIYYAIGAAALTGGLVALISGNNKEKQPSVIELPLPPSRP